MRRDWLRAYADAWENADAGVAELFSEDATYLSQVFREPHTGRDGIRAYWAGATATQKETRVLIGDPLIDGDHVVAEWWTTMVEEDGPVTLPGVLLLDFAGAHCRVLREYWAYESGRHHPFPEWGSFEGDPRAAEHAAAWTREYEKAWRAGDARAAAQLYADDVVFRSHAFREPARGRPAVHEYTAQAFASEEDRAVRLGRPIAAGTGAAVEYWTTYVEEGAAQTLAGCVLMSFDANGAVTTSRDYWHVADERCDPPPGWGGLG